MRGASRDSVVDMLSHGISRTPNVPPTAVWATRNTVRPSSGLALPRPQILVLDPSRSRHREGGKEAIVAEAGQRVGNLQGQFTEPLAADRRRRPTR